MRPRSGGFTLVEMLVALAIASMVVLLAHRVFAGVADGARRVSEARTDLDREANARRVLTALVGSLDIGRAGTGSFDGDPGRVAFSTWFVDASGWAESRRVTLALRDGALVVDGPTDNPIRLADSVVVVAFDYLLDYGADAAWVRTWESPVSAPLAIRLRMTRGRGTGDEGRVDTLLLIVGTRG